MGIKKTATLKGSGCSVALGLSVGVVRKREVRNLSLYPPHDGGASVFDSIWRLDYFSASGHSNKTKKPESLNRLLSIIISHRQKIIETLPQTSLSVALLNSYGLLKGPLPPIVCLTEADSPLACPVMLAENLNFPLVFFLFSFSEKFLYLMFFTFALFTLQRFAPR